MGRLIEKVRYADSRVEIAYTETNDTSVNSYTIDSADQPKASFLTSLQELKSFLLDILDLPDEYGKGLTVKGVTITRKNDILGAVIVAEKHVSQANSPFNIATPHLPSTPYSPKDKDGPHLTPQCVKAIERLMVQAVEYIEGKRLQMEIGKN